MPRRRRDEVRDRGAVAIIVAVFVFVAMVLLAFVVDRGLAYAARANLQNAADAGALAGGQELCVTANAETVAAQYVVDNIESALVDTDAYSGGYWRYVYVNAAETVNQFFGGFAGSSKVGVGAVATAAKRCPGGGYAIFGDVDLTFNGGIRVYGGIYGGTSVTGNGSGNLAFAAPRTDPPTAGPVVSGGSIKGFGTASPREEFAAEIDVRDYADSIGVIDRIAEYRNGAPGVPALISTSITGDCAIDEAWLTANPTIERVVCSGKATVTGGESSWPTHPLRFIEAGSLDLSGYIGSTSRSMLFYTENGGVDLNKGIEAVGTLYAPDADVVFNGGPHFDWSYGQIIVKSFTINGNTKNDFEVDSSNSEFGGVPLRLVQ